jgi:MFS family permease
MVNLARLIGPALSGIVLQQFGAGICFLTNAISFVAVLTSLLMMKLPTYTPSLAKEKARTELAEGIRYINRTPVLKMALLLLASLSLLVLPFETLMPVFAKEVFSGDAATFGYIRSFMGLGAVSCALMLASLKKETDLKKIVIANTIVLGIGLLFFSRITYFPLAMLFAIVSGFGVMSSTVCLTLIQIHSDAQMRGRVMGFMAMFYFGMLPLGGLLIGSVSEKIGAPNALLCQGIVAIIIALLFSRFLKKDKVIEKQIKESETISIEAE